MSPKQWKLFLRLTAIQPCETRIHRGPWWGGRIDGDENTNLKSRPCEDKLKLTCRNEPNFYPFQGQRAETSPQNSPVFSSHFAPYSININQIFLFPWLIRWKKWFYKHLSLMFSKMKIASRLQFKKKKFTHDRSHRAKTKWTYRANPRIISLKSITLEGLVELYKSLWDYLPPLDRKF